MSDALPKGWEATTVGDVCLPFTTIDPKKEPNKIFQYIDIGVIDNQTQSIREPKKIVGREAPSRARRVIKRGDTLFSTVRTYLKNVAIVPDDLEGELTSTGIAVLRPATGFVPSYLFNWLRSDQFINDISQSQDGTMYPAVRDADVNERPIALPPTNEQHRIVEKIDALMARSGIAKEALDTIPKLLDQYRQSVLAAAFRGELTKDWRKKNPNVEPAETLLERIRLMRRQRWEESELAKLHAKGKEPKDDKWKAKYKELDTKPSVVNEIAGWANVPIGLIAECLDYMRKPVNKDNRAALQGQIPYYGANGQVDTVSDYLFDEPLVLVVEDETFIGRTKPFSYRIDGKTWVNNHAHVLRAIDCLTTTDFLNYSLMHYNFIPLTSGTTGRRKLNQEALVNAPIPVPPLAEQIEICRLIKQSLGVIDVVSGEYKFGVGHLSKLNQSILAKAFRGELVPQDPTDEPASVLLGRIRTERAALAASPKQTRKRAQ